MPFNPGVWDAVWTVVLELAVAAFYVILTSLVFPPPLPPPPPDAEMLAGFRGLLREMLAELRASGVLHQEMVEVLQRINARQASDGSSQQTQGPSL